MATKRSSTLITGVVVLAGLALGSAIDRQLPTTDDVFSRSFEVEAEFGQTAALRTGAVSVHNVQFADGVATYGDPSFTVGTWVVMDLEVDARNEPWLVAGIQAVAASGNIYGEIGDSLNSCEWAQPGIPQVCQAAIEVATDDLVGMKIRVPAGGDLTTAGDDVGIFDLGITEEFVAKTPRIELIDLQRTRYQEGS